MHLLVYFDNICYFLHSHSPLPPLNALVSLQHWNCLCLLCAGSLLHKHHFVAVLQCYLVNVLKTSHSIHHVKNFRLACIFLRRTLCPLELEEIFSMTETTLLYSWKIMLKYAICSIQYHYFFLNAVISSSSAKVFW